jgi:hypothetical protein
VQAADAYNAGMQYTIRNIPKQLDQALRRKARAQRRSLNEVALEALSLGTGIGVNGNSPTKKRDLSDIAGTWVEDPAFDEVRAEHERIEPDEAQ